MARQNFGSHIFPFISSADYSAGGAQFHFVKHAGVIGGANLGNGQDAQIVQCTVIGEAALGILQDRPKALETASVLVVNASCIAKVTAGVANIANGALLTTDATGRAIVAVATNYCYGIALNSNGANAVGDLIEILLVQMGKV